MPSKPASWWLSLCGFIFLAIIVAGCARNPEAPIPRGEEYSAPIAETPKGQAEQKTAQKESESDNARPRNQEDPPYMSLPMWSFTAPDGKMVLSGWIDREKNVFYAFKGVAYTKADLIPTTPLGPAPSRPLGDTKLVEVDPPIYYLEVRKDEYAPGYYTKGYPTFFPWKGVTLKKNELPDDLPATRILDKKKLKGVTTTMPPPKHILADPARWKKVPAKPE